MHKLEKIIVHTKTKEKIEFLGEDIDTEATRSGKLKVYEKEFETTYTLALFNWDSVERVEYVWRR